MTLAVAALVAGTACTKGGKDGVSPRGGIGGTGILRVGVVRPTSLDPAQARSVDEILLADQLFDSLTAADPKTLAPTPALAASWTVSDDQQHWDFTLRPDARFSDGSAITSSDVKASFERVARKGSGSSVSDLLESVTGYRAFAVDGTADALSGVVASDPGVVHLDLDAPLSVLPSILSNPALGIVPKSVDPTSFPDPPIGSGPYRTTSHTPERISLALTEGAAGKTKRVDFLLFDDKSQSYKAFVGNLVDWSEVPTDLVAEAGKRFGRNLYRPYLAELFYAFNLKNPKFGDLRFREALVRAVDRKAIVAEVYGGTVRVMDGLVVDGLDVHQDDPCAQRCGFDPDRSKALVAEIIASGGSIPEIQIDFDDDATQGAVAEAIRNDLAAVGVTATLRPKPLAEYQQFAVTGDQELFRLGWIAPYPSADGILAPLFLTGFPNNLTGLSSATVDEQLRAARAEPDGARRTELFRSAERAVLAELPIIPIAQFEVHAVASPRVRGLTLTAAGTFDARTVTVTSGR